MIAYFFPPEGVAGSHRPLRFVRQLPKVGWQPRVVSVSPYRYERYDPGLNSLVPSEIEVVRVRSRDPWQAIQGWREQRIREKLSSASGDTLEHIRATYDSRFRSVIRDAVRTVETWCYRPDITMGWIWPAVEATVGMCNRNRPTAIWATAGPVSSLIVAHRASQRTGVPYVVDFRDPWTIAADEFEAKCPAWLRLADRRAMYRVLKEARGVVFQSDTVAECYWNAYRGAMDASKIHIIPNGYEGTIDESTPAKGDNCTILYSGTLSYYRYDTLLQAISSLKQLSPILTKQLRVLFVGEDTEALAKEAATLGLTDIVTTPGAVSYAEITRLEREAHAFLMLGQRPVKGYELYASSKLFSYLKAGRPILGVLPSNEAKKILHRVGSSTVADVDSPLEIVSVLQRILNAWSTGTLSSLLPNRAACEVYSSERQTPALVRALEGTVAADPFVPGMVAIPPSLREELALTNGSIACGRRKSLRMPGLS